MHQVIWIFVSDVDGYGRYFGIVARGKGGELP